MVPGRAFQGENSASMQRESVESLPFAVMDGPRTTPPNGTVETLVEIVPMLLVSLVLLEKEGTSSRRSWSGLLVVMRYDVSRFSEVAVLMLTCRDVGRS